MNLDMCSEWSGIVNANHKQACDREFTQEMKDLKRIIYQPNGSREELAKQYKPHRLTKLQRVALWICLTVTVIAAGVSLWACRDQELLDQPVIWLITMTAMAGIGYQVGRLARK